MHIVLVIYRYATNRTRRFFGCSCVALVLIYFPGGVFKNSPDDTDAELRIVVIPIELISVMPLSVGDGGGIGGGTQTATVFSVLCRASIVCVFVLDGHKRTQARQLTHEI